MYCWAYCRYRSLSGKIRAGRYASSTTARSAAAHPATMSNGQYCRSTRRQQLMIPGATRRVSVSADPARRDPGHGPIVPANLIRLPDVPVTRRSNEEGEPGEGGRGDALARRGDPEGNTGLRPPAAGPRPRYSFTYGHKYG